MPSQLNFTSHSPTLQVFKSETSSGGRELVKIFESRRSADAAVTRNCRPSRTTRVLHGGDVAEQSALFHGGTHLFRGSVSSSRHGLPGERACALWVSLTSFLMRIQAFGKRGSPCPRGRAGRQARTRMATGPVATGTSPQESHRVAPDTRIALRWHHRSRADALGRTHSISCAQPQVPAGWHFCGPLTGRPMREMTPAQGAFARAAGAREGLSRGRVPPAKRGPVRVLRLLSVHVPAAERDDVVDRTSTLLVGLDDDCRHSRTHFRRH